MSSFPSASEKLFKDVAWPVLTSEAKTPPVTVRRGVLNACVPSRPFLMASGRGVLNPSREGADSSRGGSVAKSSSAKSRSTRGRRKAAMSDPSLPTYGLILSRKVVPDQSHTLGRFVFTWFGTDTSRPSLCIRSIESDPNSPPLWSSTPGGSFVCGASISSLNVCDGRGSLTVEERAVRIYANQSVERMVIRGRSRRGAGARAGAGWGGGEDTRSSRSGSGAGSNSASGQSRSGGAGEGEAVFLTISGHLICERGTPHSSSSYGSSRYALTFSVSRHDPRAIAFQIEIDGGGAAAGSVINQAHLVSRTDRAERFFGFGEQFGHLDCKGREMSVVVREGGTGGLGSTCCPSPHMTSNRGRSIFLVNAEPSTFDLRPDGWFHIRVQSSRMRGCILDGTDPLDAVELFTSIVGRMPPLPDWVHRGAIVGVQGGTNAVRSVRQALQRHGTPVAGFWFQDWVGSRGTPAGGNQSSWNWVLDEEHYHGWRDLLHELDVDGIAAGVYFNPFLVDVPAARLNGRRNLYREALGQGFLIRNAKGKVHKVLKADSAAAMLDLTNGKARRWFAENVIQKEVMGIGAKFWMADLGEAAPFDGAFKSGESGLTHHNRYPVEWTKLNRSAIEEHEGGDPCWFFSRAGFLDTPGSSTAMWTGYHNVTWSEDDGLSGAIRGLVSGGFSGLSINHCDIGGYTSSSHPLLMCSRRGFVRSKELLERWMEVSAFTAIFRTHEGNDPGRNAQFYDDEDSLRLFSRWATVYAALAKYRKKLVEEATERGYPVVRHPIMHYPYDSNLCDQTVLGHSFMLGHLVYVCPVVVPGVTKMTVYLPAGRWVHLWSGTTFGDSSRGFRIKVPAPLGEPPVFYVDCGIAKHLIVNKLRESGIEVAQTPSRTKKKVQPIEQFVEMAKVPERGGMGGEGDFGSHPHQVLRKSWTGMIISVAKQRY